MQMDMHDLLSAEPVLGYSEVSDLLGQYCSCKEAEVKATLQQRLQAAVAVEQAKLRQELASLEPSLAALKACTLAREEHEDPAYQGVPTNTIVKVRRASQASTFTRGGNSPPSKIYMDDAIPAQAPPAPHPSSVRTLFSHCQGVSVWLHVGSPAC